MAEIGQPIEGEPSRDDGETSFEAFFRAEFPRTVAWARVLTGDLAVAEEIAQEAMMRAHARWDQIRVYDKPGAWLRRVTTNLAMSNRDRRRAERRAVERLGSMRVLPAIPNDDEEFWRVVRILPRRQREAAILYYLEDMSVADIARELDCAEGTAKAHLHKARARIARELGLGQ